MIHHVFANRSNIGDWLSARGIQKLLVPEPVIEHLCDEPFIPETIAALSKLTAGDLIVIGGGGLFMDYFTPFWKAFLPVAERVPYCIWGVGHCDLKREMSRASDELLTAIVRKSRLTVVRDELTRSHLAACVLPDPVACPSAAVIEPATEPGWGLLHSANYTTAGAEVYEAMCADARRFCQKTGRTYRETDNRIPDGNAAALERSVGLYRMSDVILTSCLHGCILAAAMGRKVIAVSGDRKVEGFMEIAGLGDWVCDIDEIDTLPARLGRIQEQPQVLEQMERIRKQNQAIADAVRLLVGPQIGLSTGSDPNSLYERLSPGGA
jgi:hypothetical protein